MKEVLQYTALYCTVPGTLHCTVQYLVHYTITDLWGGKAVGVAGCAIGLHCCTYLHLGCSLAAPSCTLAAPSCTLAAPSCSHMAHALPAQKFRGIYPGFVCVCGPIKRLLDGKLKWPYCKLVVFNRPGVAGAVL